MIRSPLAALPAIALLAAAGPLAASADTVTYTLNFTGDQEVGGGDTDGTGTGTIMLDTDTDTVTWDFTYANIAAPTAMHIHNAPIGVNGGVVVNLGIGSSGANQLDGSTTDADIDAVFANPENFYVNIHNSEFGAGAIRAQIPEPASLGLLAAGTALIVARRRR